MQCIPLALGFNLTGKNGWPNKSVPGPEADVQRVMQQAGYDINI